MDYAVAGSPMSCIESVKNFRLQLVAEKAFMVCQEIPMQWGSNGPAI
jgi:hypothetical protein